MHEFNLSSSADVLLIKQFSVLLISFRPLSMALIFAESSEMANPSPYFFTIGHNHSKAMSSLSLAGPIFRSTASHFC